MLSSLFIIFLCLVSGYVIVSSLFKANWGFPDHRPSLWNVSRVLGSPWQKQRKTAFSKEQSRKLLGLGQHSSRSQIEDRYCELVDKYLPRKMADLGPDFIELAERKMSTLTAAYLSLTEDFEH